MASVLFIIESIPKLGLYQKQLLKEIVEPISKYFNDNYNNVYYGCIALVSATDPWPSFMELYLGSSMNEFINKIQEFNFHGMGGKFKIEPCLEFWSNDNHHRHNIDNNNNTNHINSLFHHEKNSNINNESGLTNMKSNMDANQKFSFIITGGRMEIPLEFFEYNEKNGIALSLISLLKNDPNINMHEKFYPKYTTNIPSISSNNANFELPLGNSFSPSPFHSSIFFMRIVGLKTFSLNPSIIKQLEASVKQFISALLTMNIGQRQTAIKSQLESPALSMEYKAILRNALSKLQGTPLVDAIWEGIFKFRQDGSEVSFQASLVLISPDNSLFTSSSQSSFGMFSQSHPPSHSSSLLSNSDLTELKCDCWPKTLITHSYFSINSTMAQRCLQEGPNIFLVPIGKNSEYADILKHSLQNKSLCALVHLDSDIKMIIFSSRSILANGNSTNHNGNSTNIPSTIPITSNLLGVILNKSILTSQIGNGTNGASVNSNNSNHAINPVNSNPINLNVNSNPLITTPINASNNTFPIAVNGSHITVATVNGNGGINNRNQIHGNGGINNGIGIGNSNEPNVILSKLKKTEDGISNPIPESIDHLKNRQIYMELSRERQFEDDY